MSTKDITIVITSFKSEVVIKNCLESIQGVCKTIVVENSSNLNFKTRLEKEFKNVECILTGKNLGYGKANNLGLKKVETKYALILNPDASLLSSTIDNFFKVIKSIPDFAIIGPYIQEKKQETTESNLKNFLPIPVLSVKGFAMFLNLSEFKNIGFFDESFFIYFEEIDLCKRLININKKIYLAPTIKINHSGGQSHDVSVNKEMELSRNWHWMWSTFYFHKKHKGYFFSFIFILPKLASAILKIVIYTLMFNNDKKNIYFQRFSGIFNAMKGNLSWYRPKV